MKSKKARYAPLILHLAHKYKPSPGGTATRIASLCEGSNFKHLIVTPGLRNAPQRQTDVQVEQTLGWSEIISRYFQKNSWLIHLVRALEMLVKALRQRPDIVHAHNPISYAFIAYLVARLKGKPLVYEIHRLPDEYILRNKWSSRVWIKLQLERIVSNYAEKIIAQSRVTRTRICAITGVLEGKVEIVPMGVDQSLWRPIKQRSADVQSAKPELLYAGSLDTVSGADFLLAAYTAMPAKIRNLFQLSVFGWGPLADEFAALASCHLENVHYGIGVSYQEMPELVSRAHAILIPLPKLPCWEANTPTKLLEAAFMKKTIITSNVSVVNELSSDGFYLYEAQNINSFHDTIHKWLGDFTKGKAKAPMAVKVERWAHLRCQVDCIYEEIVGKKNGI
jgi:glycosyltransferase involved in cell wall biosynthesis